MQLNQNANFGTSPKQKGNKFFGREKKQTIKVSSAFFRLRFTLRVYWFHFLHFISNRYIQQATNAMHNTLVRVLRRL